MMRYALALASAMALIGCGSSSGPLSQGPSEDQQAQLAAYAATNQYPTNMQASNNLQAAAILNKGGDTITIRNFSEQTLHNAKVWVNGAYVREVDVIPAHGSVVLNRGQFFNSAGRSLSDQNVSVANVQIQSSNQLYNLQGPQFE